MDDITSNRHAGVIVVSLAILILGLVSTLMGAIESTRLNAPPATTEAGTVAP
jgi:Flp pilus assembly pilin Flp